MNIKNYFLKGMVGNMKRLWIVAFVFFAVLFTKGISAAEEKSIIAPDGGWCWFSEDRAIEVNGKTYIGYLTRDAKVGITQIDYDKKEINSTFIANLYVTSNDCADDHNHPSILPLPDGRLMVFYQNHSMERRIYYKFTINPGDITQWSGEYSINTSGLTSYANAFYLEAEKRIYLFSRINNVATMLYSDDLGLTWSDEKQMIYKQGARPYVKYSSNGYDEIYIAFTDGHPRVELNNGIHYMKYKDGAFYGAGGNLLTEYENLPINMDSSDSVYVPSMGSGKAWVWDVAIKKDGTPAILYTRYPNDETHEYWYASYENGVWKSEFLINSGKWIPTSLDQTAEPETNYSAGLVFDSRNADTIYLSTTVNNTFEIQQWQRFEDHFVKTDDITENSAPTKDVNVRPYSVRNYTDGKTNLLWMNGDYICYTNYYTKIATNYDLSCFTATELKVSNQSVFDSNPYIFYYDFENIENGMTKDLIRNLQGNVEVGAKISNGALKSNGYNSAPLLINSAISAITGMERLSISLDVTLDKLPKSGYVGLMGQREGTNSIRLIVNSDGSIQFDLRLFEGLKSVKTQSGAIVPQTLTNVVATYSQESIKIYVNGVLKQTLLLEDKSQIYSRRDSAFVIGGTSGAAPLEGTVDNVGLYSCTLGETDIAKLLKNEKPYPITSSSFIMPKPTTTTAPLLVREASNESYENLIEEIPIKAVTANVASETAHPIEHIWDNKLNTYYTAAPQTEPIILVDFGTVKKLNAVAIAFFKGVERQYPFEIEYSEDGENWEIFYIGNSNKSTNEFEAYRNTPCQARYVRVHGHGSDASAWTGIYEIKCFEGVLDTPQERTQELYQNSFNSETINLNSTQLTQTVNGLTYGKKDASFSVTTQTVAGRNNVIKLHESTPKAGSSYIEYVLPTPATEFLTIEADINQEAISSWGGIWAFDHTISSSNQALLFCVVGNATSAKFVNQPYDLKDEKVNMEPMQKDTPCIQNTWYRIKLILNIKNQTYDVYIDGDLVAQKLKFRLQNINEISSIKIATGNGAGGTMLVDNLVIATNAKYIREVSKTDDLYVCPIDSAKKQALESGTYCVNLAVKEKVLTIIPAFYSEENQLQKIVAMKTLTSDKPFLWTQTFQVDSPTHFKLIAFEDLKSLKPIL